MRVTIPRKGKIGDVVIEPGDYMVGISTESGQLTLTGRGTEYHLMGTRRPAKKPVRRPTATFAPAGDPIWVLTFQMPPKMEWVAFIKLEKRDDDDGPTSFTLGGR